MKKILLTVISILIVLFSSVLVHHVFSEDSIKIDQTDEKEDTTENIMNEIDESLLSEDDEVELGGMV